MARKHEASRLLKEGKNPLEISQKMEISVASVMQYLFLQIMEGAIQRSDILFSIQGEDRKKYDDMLFKNIEEYKMRIKYIMKNLLKCVNLFDISLLFRFTLGDMYDLISDIELFLHKIIIVSLKKNMDLMKKVGGGKVYLQKSVVIVQWHTRRTMSQQMSLFLYANFMHLKKVIDKNWRFFSAILPKQVIINKNKF